MAAMLAVSGAESSKTLLSVVKPWFMHKER